MEPTLDLDYTIELSKGIFAYKIIIFTNLNLNYINYCKKSLFETQLNHRLEQRCKSHLAKLRKIEEKCLM